MSPKKSGIDVLPALPLIVDLHCLDDCSLEEETLAGVARIRHVSFTQISDGIIETAIAVLLHSLAWLPRAAQRRLQPWQLILCLGSTDKGTDSSLANDLGLHLLHVDTGRTEEIANTVMALVLGMLRHTHILAEQGLTSLGWLGTGPMCHGMRRCRGLVMGIVGRSASACALASRTLAFRMKVMYFEVDELLFQTKDGAHQGCMNFPSAARKVQSLKELLAASDVLSLHCSLTTDTLQLINTEALQHIKPGALLVNIGSSHLIDASALKQALINGTVAGCALEGVEGPEWLEAWVREMPNVQILPRSATYSEEAWMEVRAKAATILRSFLLEGVIPSSAVSDEEDDDGTDLAWQEEGQRKLKSVIGGPSIRNEESKPYPEGIQTAQELRNKQTQFATPDPRIQVNGSNSRKNTGQGPAPAARKGKRRPGRRMFQRVSDSAAIEDVSSSV